jgi:hypothetical protein
MKISSGQKNLSPSARELAQGCLTANLAVPGLGSVISGRKVGFVQMVIYFSGFALTFFYGGSFVFRALTNWSAFHAEFYSPDTDIVAALADLWHRTRWAFLGILLCAVGWLWALSTSRTMLAEAKEKHPTPT